MRGIAIGIMCCGGGQIFHFCQTHDRHCPQEKRFSASLNAHTHELRCRVSTTKKREEETNRRDFKLNSRRRSRSRIGHISYLFFRSGSLLAHEKNLEIRKEERQSVTTNHGQQTDCTQILLHTGCYLIYPSIMVMAWISCFMA